MGEAVAHITEAAMAAPAPRGAQTAQTAASTADPLVVLGQLAEAAATVSTPRQAERVLEAVGRTPLLSESGIAPEVLEKLLPDEGVVELPRVTHVNGGMGYRVFKRAFDLLSCSLALVVLCIPMAVIACKVKTESPGPIIFAQRRVGRNGKVFKIYKFRSMRIDAEVAGAQWATEDDPRVTKTGKFLRKTRLDEIPQFWNVVRGDMSLIGPRPERPAFHEEFEKRIHGWSQRTLVRPGITGLAQVSGGYDLLPKEKALFDIEYIEHRGVRMDWGIIWHTLKTMITGKGAR